jgi:molybdopterin-binding protein
MGSLTHSLRAAILLQIGSSNIVTAVLSMSNANTLNLQKRLNIIQQ